MLANDVLGNGQFPTDNERYTLPLKVRFEDEVPKPVEKTEYEMEMDNLFNVLDCSSALGKAQPLDYPKVSLSWALLAEN